MKFYNYICLQALPRLFLKQWCLRVSVSRCGPAAVVGRGC